jgi:hypothetical protein
MPRASRAAILRERHAPKALAGVLAGCDLVVGMRLHSLVFAASAGVPVVGLVYDPKVASLMTRLGVEQYALALTEVAGLLENGCRGLGRQAIRADPPSRAPICAIWPSNAGLAIRGLEGHGARTVSTPPVEWLSAFTLGQTRRLAEQQVRADEMSAQAATVTEKLAAASAEVDALTAQVSILTGSIAWRAAEALRRSRRRLAPRGTWRDRVVRVGLHSAVSVTQRGLGGSVATGARGVLSAVREWVTRPRGVWAVAYRQERCGTVTLYTDQQFRDLTGLGSPCRCRGSAGRVL